MASTLNAVTRDSGVTLHLSDDDVRDFHALPPLPRPEPEDFEPPSLIVTDIVTGRVWDICRFIDGLGCQCGCAVYAEDITESWEAFLAEEEAAARQPPLTSVSTTC
jgi:hypothetical protein